MARNIDPVCKMCRREQMKLFLKGERCFTPKCPIDREAPPPGMHGMRRSKQSEYGLRLREKQKLKRFYGVLDNVVHRLGFANCRGTARQMVAHGHIEVNGRKCDIPSMIVKPGDTIKVKARDRSLKMARDLIQRFPPRVPDFLELTNTGDNPEGRMTRLPSRQDVDERIADIREQLIIEIAAR